MFTKFNSRHSMELKLACQSDQELTSTHKLLVTLINELYILVYQLFCHSLPRRFLPFAIVYI